MLPPTWDTKVTSDHLQSIEDDSISTVNSTPIPSTPADGRPVPVSNQRMALDGHKGRGYRDRPSSDTIHAVDQGDHRQPAVEHQRPCQREYGRRHARVESRDPDKTHSPPTYTTNPSVLAAPERVPDASGTSSAACT